MNSQQPYENFYASNARYCEHCGNRVNVTLQGVYVPGALHTRECRMYQGTINPIVLRNINETADDSHYREVYETERRNARARREQPPPPLPPLRGTFGPPPARATDDGPRDSRSEEHEGALPSDLDNDITDVDTGDRSIPPGGRKRKPEPPPCPTEPQGTSNDAAGHDTTAVTDEPAPPVKRKRGRPIGSKNKPKDPNLVKRSVGRPQGSTTKKEGSTTKKEGSTTKKEGSTTKENKVPAAESPSLLPAEAYEDPVSAQSFFGDVPIYQPLDPTDQGNDSGLIPSSPIFIPQTFGLDRYPMYPAPVNYDASETSIFWTRPYLLSEHMDDDLDLLMHLEPLDAPESRPIALVDLEALRPQIPTPAPMQMPMPTMAQMTQTQMTWWPMVASSSGPSPLGPSSTGPSSDSSWPPSQEYPSGPPQAQGHEERH